MFLLLCLWTPSVSSPGDLFAQFSQHVKAFHSTLMKSVSNQMMIKRIDILFVFSWAAIVADCSRDWLLCQKHEKVKTRVSCLSTDPNALYLFKLP